MRMNWFVRGGDRRLFSRHHHLVQRAGALLGTIFLSILQGTTVFGAQHQPDVSVAKNGDSFQQESPPKKPTHQASAPSTTAEGHVADGQALSPETQVQSPTFPPCQKLPEVFSGRRPFIPGERLTYDLDLTGAAAGMMTLEALNIKGGRRAGADQRQTLRLTGQSGTFASKFKNASAAIQTTIDLQTIFPMFSTQEISVDGQRFSGETTFPTKLNMASSNDLVVKWKSHHSGRQGKDTWITSPKALDFLSTFYFFRTVFLKPDDELCVDVMVLRQMWRLEGKVVGREHVSTPAGEFDVLHLEGRARRHDKPQDVREIHCWISEDDFRLPVAVMGVTRQGTIRAILSGVRRSDLNLTPARPMGLTW